jgi:hypothetical protein
METFQKAMMGMFGQFAATSANKREVWFLSH